MEHVYTVFREDYDEHNEGHQGMWDNCFRSLKEAKAACERDVADIWEDASDLPIPSAWHWFECSTRNNCWILDDTETGTVHTIVQANVAEQVDSPSYSPESYRERLESKTEMTPKTAAILDRVLKPSGPETCWWSNPELNDAIESAVKAGWVYRKSTTQAHWTDEGIKAYKLMKTSQIIEVQVKAIDGWTTHSTHSTWREAKDQCDMVQGRIYVASPEDTLEFSHWSNHEENYGYNCWDYFDEGIYLGPDSYGVEPVFGCDE